jgi:hypothetical protein
MERDEGLRAAERAWRASPGDRMKLSSYQRARQRAGKGEMPPHEVLTALMLANAATQADMRLANKTFNDAFPELHAKLAKQSGAVKRAMEKEKWVSEMYAKRLVSAGKYGLEYHKRSKAKFPVTMGKPQGTFTSPHGTGFFGGRRTPPTASFFVVIPMSFTVGPEHHEYWRKRIVSGALAYVSHTAYIRDPRPGRSQFDYYVSTPHTKVKETTTPKGHRVDFDLVVEVRVDPWWWFLTWGKAS